MKILFFGKLKKFIKNKKKVLLLAGMALLLVITGVLNYKLNMVADDVVDTSASSASFFDSYKLDRTASRESQISLLNEIIDSQYATASEKSQATTTKSALVSKMEKEMILEGLIKAKGFQDAVVTIGSDYYNVIVKGSDLSTDQINQILSVVTKETGTTASNIKIVPVE